jgi:hypothetical protein
LVEAAVSDREGALEVRYTSRFLRFRAEDLWQFPFFDSRGNPSVRFSCAPANVLDSLALSERLQGYFRFYASLALKKENPAPLASASEGSGRLLFEIDREAADGGVTFKGGNFVFKAASADQLSDELNSFFRALDERFPYQPGFVATWGMDGALLKHVGMTGQILE